MALTITTEDVARFGVVGAGGAGFPTHVKLSGKADTVVLNAAECEPCDSWAIGAAIADLVLGRAVWPEEQWKDRTRAALGSALSLKESRAVCAGRGGGPVPGRRGIGWPNK